MLNSEPYILSFHLQDSSTTDLSKSSEGTYSVVAMAISDVGRIWEDIPDAMVDSIIMFNDLVHKVFLYIYISSLTCY